MLRASYVMAPFTAQFTVCSVLLSLLVMSIPYPMRSCSWICDMWVYSFVIYLVNSIYFAQVGEVGSRTAISLHDQRPNTSLLMQNSACRWSKAKLIIVVRTLSSVKKRGGDVSDRNCRSGKDTGKNEWSRMQTIKNAWGLCQWWLPASTQKWWWSGPTKA